MQPIMNMGIIDFRGPASASLDYSQQYQLSMHESDVPIVYYVGTGTEQ